MKALIIFNLITAIIKPSTFSNESITQLDYKKYFNFEKELELKKEESVNFLDGSSGYLLHYFNQKEEFGAILFNETKEKVVAVYNSPFNPIKSDNNICIDPFQFVNEEKANNIKLAESSKNNKGPKKVSYANLDFDYSEHEFFKIKNPSEVLYTYSSSELSQVKLNNVPNYYNSTYTYYENGEKYYAGCSPTTALSYFAYLDRYCNSSILEGDYPLEHDDNKAFVDNSIKNLGDNFFNTTVNGTTKEGIISGYPKYLNSRGFLNYKTYCVELLNDSNSLDSYAVKTFNQYFQFIMNYQLPVHLSKGKYDVVNNEYSMHSLLGIGGKIIHNKTKSDDYYFTVNCVYDDKAVVADVEISEFKIRRYYYVCK